MQNTPQAFRGAGAPSINFSEHSYDNHVGAHCQPARYQPYPNQPYHPVPPRPHHYGNHQMQQNMPYRHHSGGYAPNQNQYGSNMNQDMYRNHSGYGGVNNRNMSSKPWTENNSGDMMAQYGQVPHPQMMNNPQMPVSSMRSPPHATSNMNPNQAQGQQHYHQMQSPAHSPHSWSQAQIPSPGVMHSSRTTPSPLPTHVRSPGHSQPFSPPAAPSINIPSHQQPPENGQLPQNINTANINENQNPSNPLHSLQKMVMIEQEQKAMLPMLGEGNDQFVNHCPPQHNYIAEENINTESKDSSYSTYYNMDENRFESKPTGSTNYPNVPQASNCNFQQPSHVLNSEEIQNNQAVHSSSTNVPDGFPSEQNLVSPEMKSTVPTVPAQTQHTPNIIQSDSSGCPPHAESAPVFTDQTKAAVSTNSELALESKLCLDIRGDAEKSHLEENHNQNMKDESSSEGSSAQSIYTNNQNQESDSFMAPNDSNSPNDKSSNDSISQNVKIEQSSNIPPSSDHKDKISCDLSKDVVSVEQQNSSILKVTAEVHHSETEDKDIVADIKDCSIVAGCSKGLEECDNTNSNKAKEIVRNPVKVVIHRIRKDNESDTWHVPDGNKSSDSCINVIESEREKKPDIKIPNVGPQIVILSPAKSQREFGFQSSVDENSVITIKEEINDDCGITPDRTKSIKKEISPNSSSSRISDKRRGRPVGSKNKIKPGVSVKRKGRRGNKRKKLDDVKLKHEILNKSKKVKSFNGPYVHITGSKANPSSISVVNVAQKEEEKIKVTGKRSVTSTTLRIKKKIVGHLSTLSPTYDAFNRDKTWLCIFCHKGSHIGGLGDLYGPYYIKDKNYGGSKVSTPCGSNSGRKKRKSDHDDRASKRSKQATSHSTSVENTPIKNSEVDPSDPDAHLKETWIHEDCAIWCQSISLLGEEVQGLEEAVTEAYENTCCVCNLIGATLGCWAKGCKEFYHYRCAKVTGCQMNIEKFALLCPNHQQKYADQGEWCQ